MTQAQPGHVQMVTIGAELLSFVVLGVLSVEDVTVTAADDAPPRELKADEIVGERPEQASRVAIVRTMYRRMGIDPTKTRPSSEALLRRLRRGKQLPRINSLVDTCNACSVDTQLPFGLYDYDQIVGPIDFRPGRPGDEYEGIRKGVVHLAGRPALFDQRGPFGNPTSDSARTMVTTDTSRALVVVYAPRALPVDQLAAALDVTARRVAQATGGVERGRWVVGDV